MSKKDTLLIEIGVEELPPDSQHSLAKEFAENLGETLQKIYNFSYSKTTVFSTPRRLAAQYHEINEDEESVTFLKLGPPLQIAFDRNDKPLPPAEGFAKKCGVSVNNLLRIEKEGRLAYKLPSKSRTIGSVLGLALVIALQRLHLNTRMRWGKSSEEDGVIETEHHKSLRVAKVMYKDMRVKNESQLNDLDNFEFVRPVRWLCALYGDREINFKFNDLPYLQASRCTRGHPHYHCKRNLKKGPSYERLDLHEKYKVKPALATYAHNKRILLEHANSYHDVLRDEGKVEADPVRRRERILEGARKAAKELGGQLCETESLLDETTAMTEWPVAIKGQLERRFMKLPREVILTILQEKLKAFSVSESGNDCEKLLPGFVVIANIDSKNKERISKGYERVADARLEDALFFYKEDRKKTLRAYLPDLADAPFHKKLGSLADKTKRVQDLAELIASRYGAELKMAREAAELCKIDLLTDMVREYPSLQGTMGKHYALHDGLKPEVATALEEHMLPRQANDILPETPLGITLALADRLDSLVGIFAIGYEPDASGDPLGARRLALGVLRILVECNDKRSHSYRHSYCKSELLIQEAQVPYKEMGLPDTKDKALLFLSKRFKSWCSEFGFESSHINMVCAKESYNFDELFLFLKALKRFEKKSTLEPIIKINKRLKNILRRADTSKISANPHLSMLEPLTDETAEKELFESYKKSSEMIAPWRGEDDHFKILLELSSLQQPLDRYFADVMVMCKDEDTKINRLALLSEIHELFLSVADFSLL